MRTLFVLLFSTLLLQQFAIAQNTWSGATSTDWNTATNWSMGTIPTATDNVMIPNTTNQPTISTTGAVAKTVEVESGATLTIQNTGMLAVNGFKYFSTASTAAFLNFGTVENSGALLIGNISSVGSYGIRNSADFNNNTGGQISIDRSTEGGILNDNGTFTNAANITIGASASVGALGIRNNSSFNNTSGQISIDRTVTVGLRNFSGTFTNSAIITIGALASVGIYGLQNFSTFNNSMGGQISIDRSLNCGLNNHEGTFTNSATIIIGGAASVGSYGVLNEATFNNNGCAALLRIISDNIISGGAGFSNSGTVIENASGSSNIGTSTGLVQNLNGGNITITNNPGVLTTTNGNLWKGCTNTDWNTATNWSMGIIPTATDDVVIPNTTTNQPVISTSGAVAKSVEVQSGATLTIQSTGTLAVNGSKTISSATTAFYNNGTVENSGGLLIGNASSVGNYGLWNNASFNNNTGGQISIDRSTEIGLYNRNGSGTFINAATITIGGAASVGNYGLLNQATFNNNTGGQISIDRSTFIGLNNGGGTFTNAANITIGGAASVGDYGLSNFATFNNNTGGQIIIDNSTSVGLNNDNGDFTNGTFTNMATITIGGTASVGETGIWNLATFNNNSGGQISIDRSSIIGLDNYNGTFTNTAIINIGAAASVGDYGLWNTATFNNSGCNALLRVVSNSIVDGGSGFSNSGTVIENTSGTSNIGTNTGLVQNLNGGTFTITNNSGVLTTALGTIWKGCTSTDWNTATNWSLGTTPTATDDVVIPNTTTHQPVISTSGAVAKTVEVQSGATLTIQGTGTLAVNGSKTVGDNTTAFYNNGTVENSGGLLIGNISSVGSYGLWNNASFNNNTGGQISIDRSSAYGLLNNGTFTNVAAITIGGAAGVGNYGLRNQAAFNNNTGGQININRSTTYGLRNFSGTFTNAATISIGGAASVGIYGLANNAAFNNNTGGQININRSTIYGLFNGSGTFTNAAAITIGGSASVGDYGLANNANFNNNTDGQINIDRSTFMGLRNFSGTFTNGAAITIGGAASVGENGLYNNAAFNNNTGGQISISLASLHGLLNDGPFTNAAILTIWAASVPASNGLYNLAPFNNNTGGHISIDNSTSIGLFNVSTFTNAAAIIIGASAGVGTYGIRNINTFNNSGCNALLRVISDNIISGGSGFSNSGTVIENASGTSNIGTNTGLVQNLNGGTFTIATNSGMLTTAAGTIWTGCTSTDWNTATNWSLGIIPTATDNVVIPNTTNQPVISTSGAVAKTVEIQSGATLIIQSTGILTVNGFNSFSGAGANTSAFYNNGTVENSGGLLIGNVSSVGNYGIRNDATFNNNTGGHISIDRSTWYGLYNSSGTFTNAANITIGAAASVGDYGLYNIAIFNNNTGGQISIDRSTYIGLVNGSGTFTNAANITIGGAASVGDFGLMNDATFNNNSGGQISIDRSTIMGLYNSSGTFTNAANITIGGTATVGAYGLRNFATFNNNTGGQISIDRSPVGLFNSGGTFTNSATITIGAVASVGSYGLQNNATFNNSGCKALLRVISDNIISGGSGFSNSGTVIENASGTSNIGTNTGLVQNLNGGTFTIATNSGMLTTAAGTIWKGCTSTDWNTASNWSLGTIPTATDDVVIPNTTNQPVISTLDAVAKTVEVKSGATLTIQSTGQLEVNESKNFDDLNTAFYNEGTVANSGKLLIGNLSSVGEIGLINNATFNNNTGGQIIIDRSLTTGLYNQYGTFINAAAITIGAVASVGNYGLFNRATFYNNTGGQISIDRSPTTGLYNYSGTFTNAAAITIGAVASVGYYGIRNEATFNNNTGGQISIDRSTSVALGNNNGSFTNAAVITIGAAASVGYYGIRNEATFNNNTGGQISIDRSTLIGLYNNYGTFTNAATLTIGAAAGVVGYSLWNRSIFNNSGCARLSLSAPLYNVASLTNAGLFTVNTTGTHTNYGFTNNGILTYPMGNPIPNVTNNALIVSPIAGCVALSPALEKSSSNSFTIGTTWYQDANLTTAAGTYNATTNTFTPSGLAGSSTYMLYFEVTRNTCIQTVPIRVTISPAPATPGSITGYETVCAGATSETYSVAAVSGATDYTWTLPQGWSGASTTNSITVTAGTSGGTISVVANNPCGASSASTMSVSVNSAPAQPGSIGGAATVSTSTMQTYNIIAVSGATSYTWSYSGTGAIITGSGISISVNFSSEATSGILSVTANNSCGSSMARTLNITVNGAPVKPGQIKGPTDVCVSKTGFIYSIAAVTGATSYTWKVPAGWSITSGQGSTSITATTTKSATSGNIEVTASNSFGTSPARTLAVTVYLGVPAKPGKINGNTTPCANSIETYTIAAVSGATSYNWTLPAGWVFTQSQSNTSITVRVGTSGGTISVTALNGCGSSSASTLSVKMGKCSNMLTSTNTLAAVDVVPVKSVLELKAFPNPAKSHFNLQLLSDNKRDAITVIVYNQLGQVVDVKRGLYAGQIIQVGDAYRQGTYFVEMIQGINRERIQVAKIN